MARDFQEEIFAALEGVLEPIARAATDEKFRRQLFKRLGWQTDPDTGFPDSNLIAALVDFAGAFQTLQAALATTPKTLEEVATALKAAATTVTELQKVAALGSAGAPAQFRDAALQLLNLLVVEDLQLNKPVLYELLRLLTVIRDQTSDLILSTADPTVLLRTQVVYQKLDFAQLLALLQDPITTLRAEYGLTGGLTDPNATADLLFPRIVNLLNAMNMEASYGINPVTTPVDMGPVGNDIAAHTMTVFQNIPLSDATLGGGFGLSALLEQELGLVLNPFGVLAYNDIFGSWRVSGALTVSPGGISIKGPAVTFPTGVTNGSAKLDLALNRLPTQAETDLTGATDATDATTFLIGAADGTHIELGDFTVALNASFSASANDYGLMVKTGKSSLVISGGEGDGFLASVLPPSSPIGFDLEVGWSRSQGLHFKGSAALEVSVPVAVSVGPVTISKVRVRIAIADGVATVAAMATIGAQLGPVAVVVEGVGARLLLSFPEQGGSLGPADADLGFQFPTAIGISVEAGPVSGGGFVFIDEPAGRYFGALELSVYSVAVKAFGIIETKFPDGHEGFSFLIIISAEFTPIQLGFGFTLNGVGGMVGINRTIDTDALLAAVRRGALDHVLFPEDPVKDAPVIVQELGAIFPAAEGHYVFGPLAKIGWGTPTLVEARIGLVIEFPGPRLLVLGTIRAALPKPDAPLVLLNLDVAGVLDFPKKYFSLDASLHDSKVGEFPITGDMSMRLTWGNNPNFAFAIGGFNPHFTPPGNFPKLRPATVDLGVQGNPSITLSGYFALTSNTAQTGAKLEARVSRGGANLYGFLGFDAIFVFSPFSFMGDVEGGVDVNFHGYGFSLHFHGHVQGPTPWKLDGQVCVSILFWDACVGFSVTLGGEQRVSLPGLDPWLGSPAAERSLAKQEVPGLSQALETTANWTGGLPTGAFAVATLIEAPPGTQTPVDPLGSATFRQKAVPLGIDVTRFAGTKPSVARNFKVQSATIGQEGQGTGGATVTIKDSDLVKDFFAPAQYIEMKDADKLSHPSFDLMDAGFTVSSSVITSGTAVIHPFKYDTTLFSATAAPQTIQEQYDPSNTQVATMAGRSAAAFGGIRLTGLSRFIDLPFFARARLVNETYGVTNIGTLGGVSGFPVGVSKSAALSALFAAKATNPLATRTFQVTPSYNFRPA